MKNALLASGAGSPAFDSFFASGGMVAMGDLEPVPAAKPARRPPPPETLIHLVDAMLKDLSIGLIVADGSGVPLWYNAEAAVVCQIWNGGPQGADTLPLDRAHCRLPPVLRTACEKLCFAPNPPPQLQLSDADRGLYATLRRQLPQAPDEEPLCFLRLDYRRPRGDRELPIPPAGLQLLNQLSFREREVALRIREGLSNAEIAKALNRSPLTIKTQLAAIFSKLGIRSRSRLAALLNR